MGLGKRDYRPCLPRLFADPEVYRISPEEGACTNSPSSLKAIEGESRQPAVEYWLAMVTHNMEMDQVFKL